MVGPSDSPEERRLARRRLVVGFVLLVAVSAGLVALRADPTPLELAAAVAFGALVGGGLTWYVTRLVRESGRRP